MLSYQHIYHAGCCADVHKHAALTRILGALVAQNKAITYIETHAGRGLYNLTSPEAEKTGEAREGILRLMPARKIPMDHPFLHIMMQVRQKHKANAYPGSPLIAKHILRPSDRSHLMELHPQEHAALDKLMTAPNCRIYKQDGYKTALGLCPPSPDKGMVLIDPSFEIKTEYLEAAKFLKTLHDKWPAGVLVLWYPLLPAGNHVAMVEVVKATGYKKLWHQEIEFTTPESVRGMYGSGLLVVNLPEGLAHGLEEFRAVFK